jgi:hypothetical protein
MGHRLAAVRRHVVALTAAVVLFSSAAHAQQPEAAPDPPPPASAQADTADDDLGDKLPSWAQDIIARLEGEKDGWYPRLGGMTRGSGFSLGPGYRTHFFGNRFLADVSAGVSIRNYKAIDARVRWINAWQERVEVWTHYRFEDFPQEDFFGTGLDTRLDQRTSYDFDSSDFSVHTAVKPVRWSRVGVDIGYMSPQIGPGTDESYPSTEQLFTDADAPGLLEQPNFLHTTFFADADFRDAKGNPRSGGLYTVAFGIWDDRTLQQYDFRRFDATAVHYVPISPSRNHVVSGRVGLSYVNNETGERVPFYFLAYVGGTDTIRGYREFRFKDENALWMNLEYKWSPVKYLSLVAFADAGEVRADWQDIGITGLNTGYGFGVRVHTNKQQFAKFDFGTGGGEGWQMFIKLGPSF